jgi:hypothetical protein
MTTFKGTIEGTIRSSFEVEADNEEEAKEAALIEWRYVEYEDLEVTRIEEAS